MATSPLATFVHRVLPPRTQNSYYERHYYSQDPFVGENRKVIACETRFLGPQLGKQNLQTHRPFLLLLRKARTGSDLACD